MKKQSLFLVLVSVFLLCLGACGQKESQTGKGMKIVTSFYPVYAMVKEVSGDLNDVRMIQSSSGIHSFEPFSKRYRGHHMMQTSFCLPFA